MVINGDALIEIRKLPDESVGMVFTDPPYGIPIGMPLDAGKVNLSAPPGLSNKRNWVIGDDVADDVFSVFVREAVRVLLPGACICCCVGGGGGPDPLFAKWALMLDRTKGLQFKHAVVWDKGGMGLGWHYRRTYEFVFVAQKAGKCRWFDTSHKVNNVIRHIAPVRVKGKHPTEKPVALAEYFIGPHSQEGDLVLDPFCGTGSTGVAAAKMDRKFMGVELDAKYCRVAQQRIAAVQTNRKLDFK
jgi:site-specific DNA-methyltransferase (adenine-specific)